MFLKMENNNEMKLVLILYVWIYMIKIYREQKYWQTSTLGALVRSATNNTFIWEL